MATARTQPRVIKAGDVVDPRRAAALDPHYNWKRALAAPGQRAVDFEERVNFRRLHDYRLARARQALGHSDLGAMLCFDTNNIRYLSSTVIGEWARDKMIRFALLAGDAEPYVWDFGSAVKHHQLYSPWLPHDHCRAGMPGLRGAIPPEAGLLRMHAEEIKSLLKEHGLERMPLGLDLAEPAMLFELQRAGIEIRDCQQVMLEARELKSIDEIMLLNTASAMVDGVYHMLWEKLKPGVRESDLVAEANRMLYQLGSDDVEAINAISGERCSPHPHNFTDRIIRPGDQAFLRYHPVLHGLPDLLLPHLQRRPRHRRATRRVYPGARMDGPHDGAGQARSEQRRRRQGAAQGAGVWLRERARRFRPAVRAWAGPRAARAPAD